VLASPVVTTSRGSAGATLIAVGAAAGLAAMAIVGAAPGSPYQPALMPEGAPTGPLARLAVALGLGELHGTPSIVLSTVVALAATAAFLVLLRAAFRGRLGVGHVVAVVLVGHLLVLFVPLLFSRDAYSYAYYGRIAGLNHANPYLETPLDHSDDPLWPYVGPKWVDTPAVYGPAWSSLSGVLARAYPDPATQIDAFRVLAIAMSLATCAVIWAIVRTIWPERTAFALAAFGANPVVLFHSIASGHNDLLLALTIVVALGLALRGREGWAVAALTIGALVKVTAVLPLALLLVWCVAKRPREERARTALTLGGIAVAIGVVFALPYLNLRDPTLGMAELSTHEGWLAPSMAFSRVLEYLGGVHGFGKILGVIPRVVFGIVLVVALARLGAGVWRRGAALPPAGLAAAWGWALLLLTMLGPVLLPWYVVWSLPLVWALPRAARTLLVTTSALLAVTLWSTEPLRFPLAFSVDTFVGRWIVTPVMLVLLIRALRDLRTRLDVGLPLEDDERPSVAAAFAPTEPREHVPAGAGQG
jgi:glycosyl transferase family 87